MGSYGQGPPEIDTPEKGMSVQDQWTHQQDPVCCSWCLGAKSGLQTKDAPTPPGDIYVAGATATLRPVGSDTDAQLMLDSINPQRQGEA